MAHKNSKPKISTTVNELSFHPEKRIELFLSLDLEERASVIMLLTRLIKKDILTHIPHDKLVELLEVVDPDDATDLLQLLSAHRRQKTIERLSQELRDMVSKLLEFDPDTAAGLMNVDYIQVGLDDDIATAAKKFKLHEKRTGRLPVILAMDKEKLAGFVPGHELGFGKVNEKIGKFVKRLPKIHQSASHHDVTELFRSHPHNKVAVLDDNENVIGIIYSDDVLRIMQEQESASLYDFAGVSAEEAVTDSTKRKVHFRYKWLSY